MLTGGEYVATMKKQLDEWSAEMDALEARARETTDDARVKYQEQLSALRSSRLESERKLEAIKAASEDSWEHLKAETANVWQGFEDSVYAFEAHFR